MKVVFLSAVGSLGGAEQLLLSAIDSLRSCDPTLELELVALGEGPLLEAASALGARVRAIALPEKLAALGDSGVRGQGLGGGLGLGLRGLGASPAMIQFVRRLSTELDALRPEVLHSNGMKAHLLSALVPRRVPRVFHHHDFVSSRPVMSRLLGGALRRADLSIAVSRAVAEDLRRTFGPIEQEVVYNAIDLDRFSPATEDGGGLDDAAGLPRGGPRLLRVGLVATYARWKGHVLFLEAAARALAEHPDVPLRFFLVGGEVYRTTGSQLTRVELEAEVARLGLEGRVGFVPFTRDTARVYRSLDVVVHASTEPEPFGLTVVEAMACGRPVVVSAAGGARELFNDGVDALGFPPGNTGALAAQLGRLISSPAARAQLGAAAHQTSARRFSHRRLGPELLALYRRVLAQRR